MTEHIKHNITDFDDIRPYDDHLFKEKMANLVREPGFEHAVRYVMPNVDYAAFVDKLLAVQTQNDFQVQIMGPFLEMLASKTTGGLTLDGVENYDPSKAYTFVTNHRDIVLDASFLNLCFIRNGLSITQVAIGNNLLIFDWITDLVKINRSFIVKRDTGVREALDAAKHLSAYIHHTLTQQHQSVWIAQREGRAKDSNDRTQDSVIKMLSLGGPADTKESLMEINIMPVAISYEFDPNDYLKVREFLLRRRDPAYHKTQHDDLFSMETGLLGYKGRVHFRLGSCINDALQNVEPGNRAIVSHQTSEIIDRAIHCGYRLFPCNYIAYDKLEGNDKYSENYTAEDLAQFESYISNQLAKIEEPDITDEERVFMRETMLAMYANPLRNQIAARGC